jgi:hypothetical protein
MGQTQNDCRDRPGGVDLTRRITGAAKRDEGPVSLPSGCDLALCCVMAQRTVLAIVSDSANGGGMTRHFSERS